MKYSNDLYSKILDELNVGVYFIDMERKIRYWNHGAEKLMGYNKVEVIGKKCSDNVIRCIDKNGKNACKKQCIVEKAIITGKASEYEYSCLHKDGHRVPLLVRAAPIRDSKNNIIGAVSSSTDNSPGIAALEKISQLRRESLIDSLTGQGNRRYTEMNIQTRIEEAKRFKWSFGILFIDIDRFKTVNDTYGHDVGDEVLKMVAKTLSGGARQLDFIGRWGGEEFIGVMTNVDKLNKLYQVARRIHLLVAASALPVGSGVVKVTISIGATLVKPGDTAGTLIKRADSLMYRSKILGKNRVSMKLSGRVSKQMSRS